MAGKRSRVVHRTRPEVSSRKAVLVTVRIREGLPSLRKRETFGVLEKAFIKGKERLGLRLLHFSVLSNHMHFLVEARNKDALTLGMQGLSIRIAKGLNRLWGRKGKVFADRFHSSLLRTQAEIRRGLRYVLQNAKKHGLPIGRTESIPFLQVLGTWLGERNGAPGSARWPRPGAAPATSRPSCPSAWTNSQAQGTNSPSRSQYDLGQPTEEGFPGGYERGGHRGNEARVKRGRRCCRRVAFYLAATPAPAFCPRRWRRWSRHPEHIDGDPESPGQRQATKRQAIKRKATKRPPLSH